MLKIKLMIIRKLGARRVSLSLGENMSETFNLYQALQLPQWESCAQIRKDAANGEIPSRRRRGSPVRSCVVVRPPQTRDELVLMAQEEAGLGAADSLTLVDDSIEAHILIPTWVDLNERCSRHDSYYDLAVGPSADPGCDVCGAASACSAGKTSADDGGLVRKS